MRKKAMDIFSCLITVILIICFVQILGYWVRPVSTDEAVMAINAFHDMPENSIEVIGFGSSHMWRGMDPMTMYSEYGLAAYNYGCNWQKVNTTSLFLQDAFRTQTPKVVLIEGFFLNTLHWNVDMDGEIYYTRAIEGFEGKRRYLDQCFEGKLERYISYYFPLYAFHDNWINISEHSFRKIPDSSKFLRTMGFYPSERVISVKIPDPEALEQREFDPATLYEMELMVQLCQEKGAQVIFYIAPYNNEGFQYAYADATQRFAEEHGCVFFDMFKLASEVGIDGETDFSDAGHLNTSGSQKVARFLGRYIAENYDMTDMRTVPGNMWEKNLAD